MSLALVWMIHILTQLKENHLLSETTYLYVYTNCLLDIIMLPFNY